MKHFIRILLLAVITIPFLTSCDNDPVDPGEQEPLTFEDGVFISCEGAFGQGNATVQFLGLARQGNAGNIYKGINEEDLGDVLQSMSFYDGDVYLVMNGDSKIVVVDQKTFTKEAEITGFGSPRYLVEDNGMGYVTDYYDQKIQVVDMTSRVIVDSIDLGVESDQALKSGNLMWVVSPKQWMGRDKNHIYSVNLTDYTVDSLEVGWNPSTWAYDENSDMVYVYCSGKETDAGGEGAQLVTVDLISGEVVNTHDLGYTNKLSTVAYDLFRDRVLFSQEDGIYTFDSNTATVSSSPIISLSGDLGGVYSIGVFPTSGEIFVGDANDFSGAGDIFIYETDGQFIEGYQVGIGPNGFYFR